ncbi:DinB family protein [Thalassovita taeanensis]|uniref:Uncharacterized damage-inducible protein DinB (Forms a four-helix bundle) n=1 Tax=Thalassovita taeanensis TaxID=657014 RepID=A0A1H9J9M1_9RHOB|nr:DinB family protein [Thalassovita taeanensis]SEQ83487.1 Uncharacterized damage-inducible protein DinB (forms a four-helix bundle) [Thalassovita taeanensis]
MISVQYCLTMARYNAWQNKMMKAVLESMDDVALHADRGAFFGSIWATANHVLWADRMWMSRFEGKVPPTGGIAGSVTMTPTLPVWGAERFRTDAHVILWAEQLHALDLVGDLRWHSGALGRDVSKPVALCIAHMFNHQAHHRGQIHAMVTAAGHEAWVSDVFVMPEAGPWL